LNNSGVEQAAAVDADGIWEDRWNGRGVSAEGGGLSVKLAPRGAAILVRAGEGS
jgi:hypothetical protein